MLETLKRWVENIKWLFNHPPTGMVSWDKDEACSYCPSTTNLVVFHDGEWVVCHDCVKKALDAVLPAKDDTIKPKEN